MGCHTWFYKKSNKLTTIPEIKEYIREHCKKNIKLLKCDYSGYTAEDAKSLIELDEELTEEEKIQVKLDIKYFENILKNLKNLNKRRKLENIFNFLSMHNLTMINNFMYETDNEYHDLFRIGNYEQADLKSLEETLDFIKNNKIAINSENYNRLLMFWEKNTDGIISFG
jgi:hypothetical protein